MGNAEKEFPEISAETLTTYVLAAVKYVEAAEVSRTQEEQHRNAQGAQLALKAVNHLRAHRTIGDAGKCRDAEPLVPPVRAQGLVKETRIQS